MAIYTRRSPSPVRKRYRSYKRFLREDFAYKCVFCGIHENDHGGFWYFHVEHYKPKSIPRFKTLKNDYTNLMYSCDHCNVYKGTSWPSDNPLQTNKGWLDPCAHDFDKHYKLELINAKLTLTIITKLGKWISGELLLDNSIRLEPLEKIALRNLFDDEIILEFEKDIADLKKQIANRSTSELQNKLSGKEAYLKKLTDEKAEKYKAAKLAG